MIDIVDIGTICMIQSSGIVYVEDASHVMCK